MNPKAFPETTQPGCSRNTTHYVRAVASGAACHARKQGGLFYVRDAGCTSSCSIELVLLNYILRD